MGKLIYVKSIFFAGLVLLSCKDTANTTIKEDNRIEKIEDATPILKEQWQDNMDEWSDKSDRATTKAILSNTTDFDSFVKALKSANMYMGLDELEETTVFIPTNVAFEKLYDSYLAELKSPNKEKRMAEILKYHMVPKEYDISTLRSTVQLNEGVLRLQTVQGGYLAFSIENDQLIITDEMGTTTQIKKPDIESSNGVIHGIEDILMLQ